MSSSAAHELTPRPITANADIALINLITENVDGHRWLPTGGLYVVAALEQAGYTVDFRDYQLHAVDDPYHPDALLQYFETCDSPVLGLGLMIDMLPLTLRAVAMYKARHPDVTVVLGGPGPSNLTDDILGKYPDVDVIVSGEGELTAAELVAALQDSTPLNNVGGLSFRPTACVRSRSWTISSSPSAAGRSPSASV